MKKDQVIKELCMIVSAVGTDVFNRKTTCDCFCSNLFQSPQVDGRIIDFIRMSVGNGITRHAATVDKEKVVNLNPILLTSDEMRLIKIGDTHGALLAICKRTGSSYIDAKNSVLAFYPSAHLCFFVRRVLWHSTMPR